MPKPTAAALKKAAHRKLLVEDGLKAQYAELDEIDALLAAASKPDKSVHNLRTLALPGMDVEIEDQFTDREGEPKRMAFGRVACVKHWKVTIRPATV